MIAVFSALAIFGIVKKNNQQKEVQGRSGSLDSFAILELFTSEGCSSCPPADRLLPQLASLDSNIVPLSFHVDYWNNLGWKDPFSNAQFSARQQEYGKRFNLESIYTPELVINGEYELVGSNRTAAEADIKKSLKQNSIVRIIVEEVKNLPGKLEVSCNITGSWQQCDLVAAIVQKHAEISVKAGENHGAILSHTNVVRAFLEQPAHQLMKFDVEIPNDLSNDNAELIVYTQEKSSRKITGAAVCRNWPRATNTP